MTQSGPHHGCQFALHQKRLGAYSITSSASTRNDLGAVKCVALKLYPFQIELVRAIPA
jgi:hypothetical protein